MVLWPKSPKFVLAFSVIYSLFAIAAMVSVSAHSSAQAASSKSQPAQDADQLSVLNNGIATKTALVMENDPRYSPEMKASLVVWKKDAQTQKPLLSKQIGIGVGGSMEVGHLTGGSSAEVFVFVDGQKTSAEVLRFSGSKATVLYELGEGRPDVFLRWREECSTPVADVVEHWSPSQLAIDNNPRFKHHQFALRVFRFNGKKYVFHHVEPSNNGR